MHGTKNFYNLSCKKKRIKKIAVAENPVVSSWYRIQTDVFECNIGSRSTLVSLRNFMNAQRTTDGAHNPF
jgi:hypothetical protein